MICLYNKIILLLNWIRLCKNWHQIILLKFRLIKGDLYLTLRNGLKLRLINKGEDSDTVVLGDMYFNRPYAQYGFSIKDNDIVVDIGANVGIFSTFAAKIADNVKVFAYEASPDNYEYLKYNVIQNQLKDKVQCFNLAVVDQLGKIKLYINARGGGQHSIYPSFVISKLHAFVEVPTTTLADIFHDNQLSHIDFLKLDCEGSEYLILLTTPKRILLAVEKIVLEWHKIDGFSVQELKSCLMGAGFNIIESPHGEVGIIYAYRD